MQLHVHRKPHPWRRRLCIAILLLVLAPVVKLLWDVYRIPDYRKGSAYVSTSPDGVYKGMDLFSPKSTAYGGLSGFLLSVSGYDSGMIMSIADGKTGQMLAYVPINTHDLSSGEGGMWECVDRKKGPCVYYISSFRYSYLELPPNRWHRLVAWSAFKLRGLSFSEISKIENRSSAVFYPNEYGEKR